MRTLERSAAFELARLVAVGVAVMAVSFLVIGKTRAAFTDTTDNSANYLEAGTITLTDDDSGTAAFNVSDLVPGSPQVRCIVVTYSGSVDPQQVKLYRSGTVTGTGLEDYLDATIEEGTGAVTFPSCAGFSSSSTVFSGTLATFASTHTDYSNGVALWDPSGSPESRVYRITLTLQDDDAAQGLSTTFDLTWEVQS